MVKIYITTIKFTNNSRNLLFTDNHGCLYCHDINNNFNMIYN